MVTIHFTPPVFFCFLSSVFLMMLLYQAFS
nr:MAG TPA: V-type proton ATPase subunit [Caudoviricetes sp.]